MVSMSCRKHLLGVLHTKYMILAHYVGLFLLRFGMQIRFIPSMSVDQTGVGTLLFTFVHTTGRRARVRPEKERSIAPSLGHATLKIIGAMFVHIIRKCSATCMCASRYAHASSFTFKQPKGD